MKVVLALLCLFIAVNSFDISKFAPEPNDLESCIAERCPTEFAKCKSTSGCEDKLKKCEAKCGAKVDYTCWSFCIGTPGAAANVCNCAVKQGCLAGSIFKMIEEFFEMINKA